MAISTVKQYGNDLLSASSRPEPVKVTLDSVDMRGGSDHRISIRTYWVNDEGEERPGKGVQIPADVAALDTLIEALTQARDEADKGVAEVAFSQAGSGKDRVAIARKRVAAAKVRKEAPRKTTARRR